jgi:hypothetical protein
MHSMMFEEIEADDSSQQKPLEEANPSRAESFGGELCCSKEFAKADRSSRMSAMRLQGVVRSLWSAASP